MKHVMRLFLIAFALLAPIWAHAAVASDSVASDSAATTRQHRFITPVKTKTNKVLPPSKDVDPKGLEVFLTGDTLKALEQARKDSISRSYTRYPLLTDFTVGLNFADMVLAIAGQDYMSADVNFTLNMWNRLQPVLEVGLGRAKNTPEDGNYTYVGKLSPYMRIGANYNFLFKHKPDYLFFLGARLGGSLFKYQIQDINHHNGYWDETIKTEITTQNGRALWYEAVAGMRVKIWKPISLGWQIKFHGLIKENTVSQGQPWFIPGYGTRRGSLAFAFNIYYTIPFYKAASTQETKPATDANLTPTPQN
mgnify:FL=1